MGDETKPLSSGDRWRPTASGLNSLQDTAKYVKDIQSGGGALSNPQTRRELGTVVLVKNESSTEEDWPIWGPVGVCVPPGSPGENPLRFANNPYFRGCRMNDFSFDDGQFRMLGITQEPIAYGKTGRVCIRGVTTALVQKVPSGWVGPSPLSSSSSPWVHVHYDSDTPRWVLRGGPGGDARLLQVLDDTNLFQDGTYNDQYVALIDLCDAPHIVPAAFFGYTTTPYSGGSCYGGHHFYRAQCAYLGYAGKATLATSPGWTVPQDKYSRVYLALPDGTPIQGRCGSVFNINYQCGVGLVGENAELTQFYAGAPGARYISYGWYQSGAATADKKVWLQRCSPPDRVWLSVVHSEETYAIYLRTDYAGSPYDGGTYGGVTYPTRVMDPDFVGIHGGGYASYSRDPNIAGDRKFYATFDPASLLLLVDDPSVWDDPIGTVKMWSTAEGYIPDGWRIYPPLVGCFPKGYGTFSGTAPTHSHGGVTAGAGTTAPSSCEPPNQTILFIQRYQ